MKKLFYSSAYNIWHSEITEQNVTEKLKDDIRAKMLGDVEKFVYGERTPLSINPELFYIGGFYYEKEEPGLSTCENIVKAELDEIEEADVVMASLLKYSSIATITEIIYAAQFPEKEIIIFYNPEITQLDEVTSEYWFPILTAQRASPNIQIVQVENENEILDFIEQYRNTPSRRIIIEGTDGVGKTTIVRKLRSLGVNCLDREKTTISACITPEKLPVVRAHIWNEYLCAHPSDAIAVLTLSDKDELERRIRSRGGAIDSYDQKASMYDELYLETVVCATKGQLSRGRIKLFKVDDLDPDAIADLILDQYSNFLRKVVVATNNRGKLLELRKIFPEYTIIGLRDARISHEVVEDGETFLDNAKKKAKEIYQLFSCGCPVIADDSGIAIGDLDGWPGVLTHRFLGENATDEERNAELIRRAKGKTARAICELVYYDGSKTVSGHGVIIGKIASSPRGKNGFGFDSVFELPDGRTLAELSPEGKNQISARRMAAVDLAQKLR
ncbi:hypothetical protein IJI79_00625 [Candidatus Saccharibacteria bacterium]|nr:hypothetical protein [Candidatus Saccharibacteria bacterium]